LEILLLKDLSRIKVAGYSTPHSCRTSSARSSVAVPFSPAKKTEDLQMIQGLLAGVVPAVALAAHGGLDAMPGK